MYSAVCPFNVTPNFDISITFFPHLEHMYIPVSDVLSVATGSCPTGREYLIVLLTPKLFCTVLYPLSVQVVGTSSIIVKSSANPVAPK